MESKKAAENSNQFRYSQMGHRQTADTFDVLTSVNTLLLDWHMPAADWKCKWTRWSVFASAWLDTTHPSTIFNDIRNFYIESEVADRRSYFVCFTNFSNYREYNFCNVSYSMWRWCTVYSSHVRFARRRYLCMMHVHHQQNQQTISQVSDLNLCIFHLICEFSSRHFNRDFR